MGVDSFCISPMKSTTYRLRSTSPNVPNSPERLEPVKGLYIAPPITLIVIPDEDMEFDPRFLEARERFVRRLEDLGCDRVGVEEVPTEEREMDVPLFTVTDDRFDDFLLLLKARVPSMNQSRSIGPFMQVQIRKDNKLHSSSLLA